MLVTAVMIRDHGLENKIRDYLKQYDVSVYSSLRRDLRFLALMRMAENPTLIRFVFKNVFGQESFAKDFEYIG